MLSLSLVRELHRHHYGEGIRDNSFIYVSDYVNALRYCEVLHGLSYVCMDGEHYNYAKDTDPDTLPLETYCWHLAGPFVALLQITTAEETYVFDILAIGTFPLGLRDLLQGSSVIKVVYDHGSEARALYNSFGCALNNVLDLQDIARQLDYGAMLAGIRLTPGCLETVSLANVVQAYLGVHLDKDLQRYRWNGYWLSEDALWYAATDSMVMLRLLEYLAAASWYRSIEEGSVTGPPPASLVRTLLLALPRSRRPVLYERPVQDVPFPYEKLSPVRQRRRTRVYYQGYQGNPVYN